MMNALDRIRDMGFSQNTHSDSQILDLLHKHINTITKGKFDQALTDDQLAQLVERVLMDLIDSSPASGSQRRNHHMPGEW